MKYNLSEQAKHVGRYAEEEMFEVILPLLLIHFSFFKPWNSSFDFSIVFLVQWLRPKLGTHFISRLALYQLDISQSHLGKEKFNYKNAVDRLVCGSVGEFLVIFLH